MYCPQCLQSYDVNEVHVCPTRTANYPIKNTPENRKRVSAWLKKWINQKNEDAGIEK